MKELVEKIISYEQGDFSQEETIDFFSELIKSGIIYSLQGHYGRTADNLMNQEYISEEGEVLKYE